MSLHPALSPGRVAVITGAASGIGLAVAVRCAGLGMRVVMADISPDLAQAAAGVAAFAGTQLTPAALTGLVTTNAETYDLLGLSYRIDYQDDGIRVNQRDVTLPLGGLEQLWVRSVTLDTGGGA